MKRPAIRVGSKVEFKGKVFRGVYLKYFETYQGHTFNITQIEKGHCQLECIDDPSVIVKGWPHDDQLKVAKKK